MTLFPNKLTNIYTSSLIKLLTHLIIPIFWFITLVLIKSTGYPTIAAQNPAIAEAAKWQTKVSWKYPVLIKDSLAWSNVANSAQLITAFLMTFGPTPLQKPTSLKYYCNITHQLYKFYDKHHLKKYIFSILLGDYHQLEIWF